MKITILGRGFGLYGYLPALFKAGNFTIILPIAYQEQFKIRKDIASFYNGIEWVNQGENILELCEGVIIALPPIQQYMWVKKCLNYERISHILLEKPVAVSPLLANKLLDNLKVAGKKFRIAYNFRYTDWGQSMLCHAEGVKNIFWDFQANHYMKNIQTWKRLHEQGGGALRFYGIHLIALLSELGYNNVSYSEVKFKENEVENWEAELTGVNLSPCTLSVASNSKHTRFWIQDADDKIHSISSPFQTIQQKKEIVMDERIPFLTKCLSDLFHKSHSHCEWYRKANLLWENVENRTLFE